MATKRCPYYIEYSGEIRVDAPLSGPCNIRSLYCDHKHSPNPRNTALYGGGVLICDAQWRKCPIPFAERLDLD